MGISSSSGQHFGVNCPSKINGTVRGVLLSLLLMYQD